MRNKTAEVVKQNNFPDQMPRLGILSYPIGKKTSPPLSNFRELALAGKKRRITVIVFKPQDVNWSLHRVEGWILKGSDGAAPKWQHVQLPLFDVVYNRIPNRKTENQNEVQWFFQEMNYRGIPFFNPSFLDKWTIFRWIQSNQEINKHLPHSVLFTKSEFMKMLEKNTSVFIKPRLGSLGRGIMRIDMNEQDIIVNILTPRGYETSRFKDYHTVCDWLETKRGSKNYIIQEAIKLARYKNRVFDIRTLVQKDIQGNWTVTGMGARWAAANAHLTHVPNGGQVLPLSTVLAELPNKPGIRMEVLNRHLHDLSINTALTIDKAGGGRFGEMSMDIGLDTQLNLWLIEANSKPFSFDEPAIRQISRNRILDYAIFLFKQREKGSEIDG